MKRIVAILLAAMLLLAGCAQEPPVDTTPDTTAAPATEAATEPEVTEEPTTAATEPPTEEGTVRVDGLGLLLTTHALGDTVTVLGKWNNYYIVEGEINYLMEERFLRLAGESEQAVESYEGWARSNVKVYDNPYFRGEPMATLALNTKLQVLDSKDNWAMVTFEDAFGYMAASDISPWYQSYSGGGGGGSQDGSDVDLGGLSAKGGDYFAAPLGEYFGTEYEELEATEATVLVEGAEGYVRVLSRDETVKVAEVTEETCTILVGMELYEAPRWAVRMAGDEAYTPWSAYCRYGSKAYSEYQLLNKAAEFSINQRIDVVDAIEALSLYVVQLETGFGYVPMDQLSETQIYVGGGGNSGGDWTPPAL